MECASLLASWRLLSNAGIRHFDTAPGYGMGQAERCLGEFLVQHKNEVTITTKFGLRPPKMGTLKKLAVAIAKPLLASAPRLKRRLQKGSGAFYAAEPVYTVESAQASLENSLRELGTECTTSGCFTKLSQPTFRTKSFCDFWKIACDKARSALLASVAQSRKCRKSTLRVAPRKEASLGTLPGSGWVKFGYPGTLLHQAR